MGHCRKCYLNGGFDEKSLILKYFFQKTFFNYYVDFFI